MALVVRAFRYLLAQALKAVAILLCRARDIGGSSSCALMRCQVLNKKRLYGLVADRA